MERSREFGSFFAEAKGGEGERCNYPVRLDTYGCGCFHDCAYCYAKSLLEPDHYDYWMENVNADRDDCCNLRK